MKKITILVLALGVCACDMESDKSRSEIWDDIEYEIEALQKQINADTEKIIEQDKIYQSCIKENAKLRKIASEHRSKYPDNPFVYSSTKEQCNIIKSIEKYHHIDLFLEGFLDKKIGYCKTYDRRDMYKYISYVSSCCSAKYKRESNITLCKNIFKDHIRIDPLEDDIGLGTYVESLTLANFDDFGHRKNEAIGKNLFDMRENTFLRKSGYETLDKLHTFKYGDTYQRLYAIEIDCLDKSGRLKTMQIKHTYDYCLSQGYSAYFCNCFSQKSYVDYKKTYNITDEVERKYAQEEVFNNVYKKCMGQ